MRAIKAVAVGVGIGLALCFIAVLIIRQGTVKPPPIQDCGFSQGDMVRIYGYEGGATFVFLNLSTAQRKGGMPDDSAVIDGGTLAEFIEYDQWINIATLVIKEGPRKGSTVYLWTFISNGSLSSLEKCPAQPIGMVAHPFLSSQRAHMG